MTSRRWRIACVFGTRPEAIKMAPVVLGLRSSPDFEPIVIVTAQHREMLDQVLDLFGIEPDVDLNMQRRGQTLTDVTTTALAALDPVLADSAPDMVLVQGDTTTTFVGALASFYRQIPVGHLEAGLRTGDRYSPFPEEINRRLATQLASLHLAPTASSAANLLNEGLDRRRVVVTGNTVIDALHTVLAEGASEGATAFDRLGTDERPVLLVTAHRRESWGEPMRAIGCALREVAMARPDVVIAFPIHRNPLVRQAIEPAVKGLPNVIVDEPLPYGRFCWLMKRAHVVLTDSGGVQEEAPALGKPVLVMRDTTERPEAVAAGTVRLVGTGVDSIVGSITELLDEPSAYARMANAVNPYGDGLATHRVLGAMRSVLGGGPLPDEFHGSDQFVGEVTPRCTG